MLLITARKGASYLVGCCVYLELDGGGVCYSAVSRVLVSHRLGVKWIEMTGPVALTLTG